MKHINYSLLFSLLVFIVSCHTSDKSIESRKVIEVEEGTDFNYYNFEFREKSKIKNLNQSIFSNTSNLLEGIWLEGLMMKYNYFHQDTSFSPIVASFNTYTFTSDSTFFRRSAWYESGMSYSGSYLQNDSDIITRKLRLEDENSKPIQIGGTKKWGYEIINRDRLLLQEEKILNNSYSYLYHRLKKRNYGNYQLEDLRRLLYGNTYFVIESDNEHIDDSYIPSFCFLNDSAYVTGPLYLGDWKSKGSYKEDLLAAKTGQKGIYLIDDFSIKNEIFIRLSHYPIIQVSSIQGDTILGYTHGSTVDSIRLIKRNAFKKSSDFNGVWYLEKAIEYRRIGLGEGLKMGERIEFDNDIMTIYFLDGSTIEYSCTYLSNSVVFLKMLNQKSHDFWCDNMLLGQAFNEEGRMAIRITRDNTYPDYSKTCMILVNN